MSQSFTTTAPLVAVLHNNRGLFSDYYLNNLLPQDWLRLEHEASLAKEKLQQLYAAFTPNPNNEAQTEEDWIRPVLRELGHVFDVQVPLQVPDSVQKPDYIFYQNTEARDSCKGRVLTEEDLKQAAYAIGDAKQWDRSLDRAVKGQNTLNNKNPSFQIFFYMLHSGLSWGILTNGRLWRLYHKDTAHKLEIFYEVNLPELLVSSKKNAFLYFYTFFRRAAFGQDELNLNQILAASTDFARGISDSLRQQIYDALRNVAQGFLAVPENRLPATEESYKQIYDNSLILLYRLLFVLYAEARNLLPVRNNILYRGTYSLYAIKHAVAEYAQTGNLLRGSVMFWARLKELFKAINFGSPPLNVTTFNGGLFDAGHHEFLEKYACGDLHLTQAINNLARVGLQWIDYRDLSVRHLGTIYEGLLEYKLKLATVPMVELKGSSKIVPAEGVLKKNIAAEFKVGEVYLVTDNEERKVTGSYYTPDYIVKYMVEETLRPLLDKAVAGAQTPAESINAVLSLNVLDPAMGSGHFPVEVTEYIARYLVELGVQSEESDESDMSYWKRRVVQQCIYGVDANPLAVELAKLSLWLVTVAKDRPLNFLDHHLRCGNALVGSLLKDVSAGRHPQSKAIQVSESVAVTAESDSASTAVQISMMEDPEFRQTARSALETIHLIEQNLGDTVDEVKAQEAAYQQLRQAFSEKYQKLADLGVGLYYGLAIDPEAWRTLADYAVKDVGHSLSPQFDAWIEAAHKLSESRHFFHWELEFPRIFFDPTGAPLGENAGFDVVIGNPPYVRQEQLGPDKPFFEAHYDVYHGVADLFVYFFAQGLHLLRQGGKLAYISSNMWLRTNYATPLRHYLRTQVTVESIVDLGNTRVFADAPDLSPSIQVVRKSLPASDYQARVAVFSRTDQIKTFREQLESKSFPISINDQLDTGWQLKSDASRVLFNKLMQKGKPLGEVVEGHMYYGIKTGLNEAFIIDQSTRDRLVKEDPGCSEIIKPMLRGEDLRCWYQENEGRWLIFTRRGIDINKYPSVLKYLEDFRARLEPRPDNWDEKARWEGRKAGPYKWYEIQDSIDYYEQFEQPKIFWPDMGKFPRFSWDELGLLVNDKGSIIPSNEKALLGILQSRVNWFCISRLSSPLAERAGLIIYQQKIQFISRLPIPPLKENQRTRIESLTQQLTEKARERYQLRRRSSLRIQRDLGTPQAKFNKRLEIWWDLPFKEFRAELQKVYKQDIPFKDRDDWDEYLQTKSAEIARLTSEIVQLEEQLNAAVYDAFELNPEERRLIEQETLYRYGEW